MTYQPLRVPRKFRFIHANRRAFTRRNRFQWRISPKEIAAFYGRHSGLRRVA